MKKSTREWALRMAERILTTEEKERLWQVRAEWREKDTGFGYDIFGAEFESALIAYCLMRFFYDKYFRVDSYGHENIPPKGRLILASNHSGIVPMDGAMIAVDCVRKLDPPRIPRAILQDIYAGAFTRDTMARLGQVLGLRVNFSKLLQMEQTVLVFPEGGRGNSKPFTKRYKPLTFNVGHVELSLENKAPIVPVGVIGAEEQLPVIYNWQWLGNKLGTGPFPVTLTWPWLGPLGLWPLPTKYYIYFGEPFRFWEEDPDALSKAELVRDMAGRVRARVQSLLDEGLARRPSVFFRG
jgi:1-acyl-sn-glycerol-3-phosphate acyltransferase